MRVFRFIIPVICALSLSACSETWQASDLGVKTQEFGKKVKEAGVHAKNTVVKYEESLPDGYTGPGHVVLKPPGMMMAPSPVEQAAVSDSGLVWNELPDYAAASSAPVVSAASAGVTVTDGVRVFSIDDVGAAAPQYASSPVYAQPESYGRLEQKLFFNHGSAAVKKTDKAKLRRTARKAKTAGTGLSVTVVGHASTRVDYVTDPLQKKMINFTMAQKRAIAVTQELQRAGMNPGWVQAVSRGDDEPNPDPGAMPQEVADRRVDLYMDER